jgi:hypothetical protein
MNPKPSPKETCKAFGFTRTLSVVINFRETVAVSKKLTNTFLQTRFLLHSWGVVGLQKNLNPAASWVFDSSSVENFVELFKKMNPKPSPKETCKAFGFTRTLSVVINFRETVAVSKKLTNTFLQTRFLLPSWGVVGITKKSQSGGELSFWQQLSGKFCRTV